ncbi:MAG: SUMF1/EgtB/PvdO family nonheme iron enzyme, partial [Planctomycetes bacterium]|nr:SUMF1/EgtB/PvdO family nonheme iron enzyme [Planctomycetota bacterium]
FCAWLAGKARARVRLPSSAEWRQAAGGGDPLRVFPWGETFDASFTVTAFDGTSEPASRRVGTKPADVGPFGHLDLAGNVHEWLSDRAGRIPGEIAGGSYGDELAHEFAVAAHAKADPTQPFSPIGFRILVELP